MTISDIAKMAGVSNAAVSRYLNGGSLSEEKRAAIRTVVQQTGYRPDAAAQTLRTGKVNQIGVITPSISSQSVGQVTAGITSELNESRYMMLLGDTQLSEEKEIEYLATMQHSHVAGIILMGTVYTPALKAAIAECKVPLVVTGQRFPDVPCVYNDDRNAAKELAARMLERGRKHLVYIGGPEKDVAIGAQRRQGVQAALDAAGLDAKSLPSVCCTHLDIKEGQRCMSELLALCPELDGVICATDTLALGALGVLKAAGRRVGRDVSLAGIGDNWADTIVDPPLTTVHFYQTQVGVEAARMLMHMISYEQPEGPVRQVTLGYTVVERGSI